MSISTQVGYNLFNRHEKKKGAPSKPVKDLIRITPSELILEEERRKHLLLKIEASSTLDQDQFNKLSRNLVHNLTDYCQLLPETANRHYSQAGGFIDYALNRTEAALSLFKEYLILDASGLASEEQKLWQYALFSAALLQGIGKFYTDLQVVFFDSQGGALKTRDALSENLYTPAARVSSSDPVNNPAFYYAYSFSTASSDKFRQRLNSIIARFIMPASGFDWIASNPKVLETWLALLNEDLYRAGTLGFILDRSKTLALQRHYSGLPRIPLDRQLPYGAFQQVLPESNSEMEYRTGIEFIQWLAKALDKGEMILDNLPLLAASGGLILLNTEIFKQFMKNNPHYKSLPAVQNGFLALGLHRLGLGGELVSRYEHTGTHKIQAGILFDPSLALPGEFLIHDYKTGKNNQMSAMKFTAQLHGKELKCLNPDGVWEAHKQTFQVSPGQNV
jgi:integrating conjugative element relaxase (TIGR03760 family)